jgi:pyruvate kinase
MVTPLTRNTIDALSRAAHEGSSATTDEVRLLIEQLSVLRAELVRVETEAFSRMGPLDPGWRASATNLLHYVALRRGDLRELQDRLATLGLSSLGRSEPHVLANVDSVLRTLHRLSGTPWPHGPTVPPFTEGSDLLASHAAALLGPPGAGRGVRILVTLPSEAAEDYTLVRKLLATGTDGVRINCAHDDAAAWGRMIAHVRRAARAVGQSCKVLMDLAGPKLRTGATAPGPRVLKWKPERDAFGHVVVPARLWLHAAGTAAAPPAPATASVPVGRDWLRALRTDDQVLLTDARDATRVLTVGRTSDDGAWADCVQTAYVTPGTVLVNERESADPRETAVGPIDARDPDIRVRPGDTLLVTLPEIAGRPAEIDARGDVVSPATVPCSLPQVFRDVRIGDRIHIDDGRIGGVLRAADAQRLVVEIVQARPKGERILADKGINLPDSDLDLPALTDKDIEDLAFVARHADAVSLSFVRDPSDVRSLQSRLAELGGGDLGIVLKIETRQGFEHLPELLLAAMRSPCVGVMIARGDLAVECGYERLAEVQEEILWFCEAAHVPAIWATQVLERLAKDGLPSRAEITDAAMGERAECVMLNKGAHIVEAVRTLDNILVRMGAHQRKKRSMLRPLRLARAFGAAR